MSNNSDISCRFSIPTNRARMRDAFYIWPTLVARGSVSLPLFPVYSREKRRGRLRRARRFRRRFHRPLSSSSTVSAAEREVGCGIVARMYIA